MKCPECGSEMEPIVRGGITMPTNPKPYLFECKKCGHESKPEVEKP
jgi:uncharacterized Zn finger protein